MAETEKFKIQYGGETYSVSPLTADQVGALSAADAVGDDKLTMQVLLDLLKSALGEDAGHLLIRRWAAGGLTGKQVVGLLTKIVKKSTELSGDDGELDED